MRLGVIPGIALVLLIFVWGYSWILNKLALLDAGPLSFSAYRMLIAASCLLLALPLTGRSLRPRGISQLLLLGLVQTTGFVGLSMWALVEGGVGSTSILVFTMPFWTLLLAWPFLGERLEGLQWLAVGLAATGLLVILHPWNMAGSLLSKLLALISGLLWAVGSIMIKRMQQSEPRDLLSLTGWQMAFGAVPLLGMAELANEPDIQWTLRFTAILWGSALVSTAMGWGVWVYVLRHVPAGLAGLSMLGVPVIAIASAAWYFHEIPATEEAIGMALITCSLALLGFLAIRRHQELAGPVGQE